MGVAPTPPANSTQTTLQVGTYSALTDSFALVFDLNDLSACWLHNEGLLLPQPEKTFVRGGNVRTPGELIPRFQYKNRHISASVWFGRGLSTTQILSTVRKLLAAIEQPPYVLRLALPGATQYSYADVVAVTHNIPADPQIILNGALTHVEIDFECRPFFRGDRVVLSNLVANPGFEAPMGGGTATTAPVAFADPFSNVNAYSVLAGGAPTVSPANTYVDVVLANGGANLLRYYRLDEASGTSVYDIGGTGQTGTTHGSPTQGVAGAISGDPDTAYTFASASSQYVSLPTSGLPTGNGAWSIAAWIKFAANPGATGVIAAFGASTTKSRASFCLLTNGTVQLDVWGSSTSAGAALSTGTWHYVVATYDGTTVRTYVDGASYGTLTPGVLSLGSAYASIGADGSALNSYFNGQLDEVTFYNAALTSTQISAIYTAGHSGATGTLSNAMSVPSGATVGFGSPAWAAIQTWQVRFRWNASATEYDFSLHRVDANNVLFAAVKPTQLALFQTVAGTLHQVAQATTTMTNGGYYWLQITQFPTASGVPPYVQATLCYDDAGAVGSQLAQIGGFTFDAVTALSGTAAIAASGAALVIGGAPGNATGAGQQVSLFGPGGWTVGNSGTGLASGAWEQNTANTAPLGYVNAGAAGGSMVQVPVTSFGAGRIDAPPTGGWSASWQTGGSWLLPLLEPLRVATGGDTLTFSAMVKASGNGSGYSCFAQMQEYNATGGLVQTTTHPIASGSGALAWQAANWSLVTQSTTAYVILSMGAADATNSSAGSTTWFDNVQCWDASALSSQWGTYAQAGMPYCELRFPNSPAQMVVSGLVGDAAAPAAIAAGTYEGLIPPGTTFTLMLGRRGGFGGGAKAQLCGPTYSSSQPSALDASSYGGYYVSRAASQAHNHDLYLPVGSLGDCQGFYQAITRAQTAQTSGNLGNMQVRVNGIQETGAGGAAGVVSLGEYYSSYATKPFGSTNVWTVVNAGPLWIPIFPVGALTDLTQYGLQVNVQYTDSTSGGATAKCDWVLLLPADGALLVASINNPSNANGISFSWLWVYADELVLEQGQPPAAWNYSLNTSGALPQPSLGAGGMGTTVSGYPNVNPAADAVLSLDPQLAVAGVGTGINQLAGFVADQNGTVLPLYTEIAYTPLYLYPR